PGQVFLEQRVVVDLCLLEERLLFLLGRGPEGTLVGLGLERLAVGPDRRDVTAGAGGQQQAQNDQPGDRSADTLPHRGSPQSRDPSCCRTRRSSSRKPSASGAPGKRVR